MILITLLAKVLLHKLSKIEYACMMKAQNAIGKQGIFSIRVNRPVRLNLSARISQPFNNIFLSQ
jgi:hypothetical protein